VETRVGILGRILFCLRQHFRGAFLARHAARADQACGTYSIRALSLRSRIASASSFDCTISDQSLTRAQPLQFVQLLPRGLFHVRFLRDKAQLTKTVVIASISSLGVIQPLLVRPNCDGYKVIVGQRRLLACRAPWPDLKSPLLKSDAG
jgi:hypothetical protein